MENKRYMVVLIKKLYFFEFVEDPNVYLLYRDRNKYERLIRRVFSKLKLPFLSAFFGNWKKEIHNTDIIIMMDNGYNNKITRYIKRKNPNCKIIFYYWNVINDRNKFALYDENIDEIWTFDEENSKKYSIRYFPQFYYKCANFPHDNPIKWDGLFLGAAKDRRSLILNAEKELKNQGLNTKIIISEGGSNLISYKDYLNMIKETRAIIEIVGPSQGGLTLRALESLFYNKKLITNNASIKDYDFYDGNNIFIFGNDDINTIKQFIMNPISDVGKVIKRYYTYETWISTLISNKR